MLFQIACKVFFISGLANSTYNKSDSCRNIGLLVLYTPDFLVPCIISGYNVPCTFSQFTEIIQMKKVLVTGGAGFVGSFLCDRLIDEGH